MVFYAGGPTAEFKAERLYRSKAPKKTKEKGNARTKRQ
jgi:hypothetical protein